MEATAFLLLLLVGAASGGPVNWKNQNEVVGKPSSSLQCATHCTNSNKFNYEKGKTYIYQYETSTSTHLNGVTDGIARIEVKATASISVLSECEMLLSLSDVIITSTESDKSDMRQVDDVNWKSALENNALRFSFQDGRVEDVCPSSKEETNSLNFKRAVLSAFQNSMNQQERDESLREVDVAGVCPTQYTVEQKGWKSSQFTKVKDLLGCTDRHDYRTSLQSTPFRLPDTIQSLPLLKGNHKCVQTLAREGFVHTSSCTESLVFRPFSRQESGARTESIQKLTYTSTVASPLRQTEPITSKSTLLFEHKQTLGSNDQNLWATRQKLTELCRVSVHDITPEVPGLFADLVYLMRGLLSKDLLDIADRVERGNICEDNKSKVQKFYQDALAMVGTTASIEVMTGMLTSNQVSDAQASFWITSLHFVQNPTAAMLIPLKNLLLSDQNRMSSLLPVSSLIHNLCRDQTNCMAIPEVGDIVDVFKNFLRNDCQSEEQNLILTTLRAIGNLGYADTLASALEKCVKTTQTHLNTRVNAVQAYRGLTCDANRKVLMDTFLNTDEDSELRIASYLGVMQCWNKDSLNQIKQALEEEEVNQVGSFVWTHLTNLMETSSIHKQALKDILSDEHLQKEFNMDKRKYSRNYETSFFSEKFGIGAMAESNLIWSSKSFLPRSAMVNLTVDVLGHSVNLLEFGGRIQGVETLLQNYFGADGVFKGGENPKDTAPSRCVKQEKMDSMKKKFSVDQDEMTASLYMRMFGNELSFQHFTANDLTSFKNKYSFKEILAALAKGQDISYTKSAMFMDTSVSVPTIAGIPLTLSINGTSTVELIANGKMEMKKFSVRKMEAKFELKPSGAVQISGVMSVNAGNTRAGLKMISTLHTSTALSGSMDLTNGQVLSMDLDTPKRNMDILDIKSEMFLLYNKAEVKQEVTMNKNVARSFCSPESVLKVLGYELCGAVSFINATTDTSAPYFPLTGPVDIAITLHKKDVPKGFRLLGKLIQNKATSIAQLSFDTPGSLVERAINIGYFLDTTISSAEVELNSPWKKILVKGSYTVDPKTKKFLAVVLDDNEEYVFNVQLDEEKKGTKRVYIPTLELSRPQGSKLFRKTPEKLTVGGSVSFEDDMSDISGVLTIKSGLNPDPIELKANYVNKETVNTVSGSLTLNQKKSYSTTFQVVKNIIKGKLLSGKLEPTILISTPTWRPFLLSGSIDFREDKMLDGSLKITMDETLKQPITLDVKVNKQKKKGQDRVNAESEIVSQFGSIKAKGAFEIATETSKKGQILNTKVNIDYNLPAISNKSLQKNKVAILLNVLDKSSSGMKKYDVTLDVDSKNYPDASFFSNFELNQRDLSTKAIMTMKIGPKAKFAEDKSHELRLELTVKHDVKNDSADIVYGLQILYPIKNIEYEIKGKHEHQLKNKFFFETYNAVIFGKGKSIELRVIGNNNNNKNNLDASGTLELNFPEFEIDGRKYDSRKYKISTSIIQNADKEYIHAINLQVNDDNKHTLVTKFKKQSNEQFDLYSQLHIARNPPLKLTVTASREIENLKGTLEFFMNNNVYSGSLNSKIITNKYQSHSWDFGWPERRVKGSIEAGQKQEQNTIMKLEIFWDADRDPTQKILGEINYVLESSKRVQKSDFSLLFTTPFENHKIYSYSRLVDLTTKEFKDEFKIIWQKVDNELSYSLWVLLPPSMERFEMKSKVVTPLESLRRIGLDVVHKFDGSRYLSSSYKGIYNDDEMTVAVLIANTGDKVRNVIDSSFTFSSSLRDYRNFILKLRHNDDGRVYSTEFLYQKNGEQYKTNLDATYFRVHYQVQVDSKLEISFPTDKPIVVKWVHTNTLTNLNSTVSLNWKPGYDTKLVVGLKINNAEKDYAIDVFLTGPWKGFSAAEVQLRHSMLIDATGYYLVRINNDPKLTSKGTYKYTSSELTCEFSGRTQGALNVKFGSYPYTLLFEKSIQDINIAKWEESKIVLEASLDKSYYSGWSANAKLVTPWQAARSTNLRANVQKTAESQWKVDSVITMGVRSHITADFNVDIDNWSLFNGLIKTPFKEFSAMNFGFLKNNIDKVYNSEMFLEIQPYFNKVNLEQSTSFEPDFISRYYINLPDTEFKFIEIKMSHAEQRRGCDTGIIVTYYPEKEFVVHVNSRYNKNKFPEKTKVTLNVVTPFDIFPDFNVVTEVDKDQDKWISLVDINTAAKEFKKLKIKMIHSNTNTSFDNDLEIESSLTETVGFGMHFDWGDIAAANLTLNAPSVGRSMIGFKRNSKSWTDFQQKVFAEISGYNLDVDIGLKHDEQITKFWLLYAYPGSEHSYLQTSLHRIGNSAHDFDVGGFLQVGKNSKPYNISMQYSMVDHKTALGTTLETPFTKALSYLVKNELTNREYVSVIYGKYDKGYLVDAYLSHEITDDNLSINTRNQFIFDGKGYKAGTKLSASWSNDELEASVEAYSNDDWTNAKLNRKAVNSGDSEKKETVDILVFTPFEDYTDIGMHFALTSRNNHYKGTWNLEYMDEHEAVLTFDVIQPDKSRATVEASLFLPIDDYRTNTLSYSHTNNKNLFSANAEVITGKGEHLDGKLEFKNNEDYTLTLTGPVEKFESLVLSGKFNEKQKKLTGNAKIMLDLSSKPVTIEYDADINKVATINIKLRSPFDDFKFADLSVQHEGMDWKQFKNKAVIKSDSFGQVVSEASWGFVSITNMEGKAFIKSSVKDMENIKLVFSTSDSSRSQVSQLSLGWQADKEISVNNTWGLTKAGDNTKFTTTFAIVTPFNEIKSASIKLAHLHSDAMFSEGFVIAHNNWTYLDADLSYQYVGKNEVVVEVRNPRPMSLSVSGSATKEHLDGTVNINWDKRTREAQVEIITSLDDRSDFQNVDKELKLKVIHPVRVMELDSTYKKANNEILSTAYLTWDKENGHAISYDVAWTNRTSVYSQMYEGHVKLGVPHRSVKVQGSYSDTGSSVTTSSAVWWDADRDEKKKVTMSSSVETKENLKRFGLNINLPSINKQMNIDGTSRAGYGSTIVDSKAEISYSPDPKKLIIVTSKIGNSEANSPNDYNYTMNIGFEHAVTDLNIKFSSHLANVGKVSSVSSQLALLTTNKEMKHVNFWAKVDRAHRNMEVKVTTPVKTVAVVGQIENVSNQRRLLLKSFEDDKQALQLDILVDPKRQNLDIEFNYDQDDQSRLIKLTGNIVNNSAIRVDLISQDGKQTVTESMVAVRLNTTNVLHTRLIWRPTLLHETRNFIGTKLTAFSYASNEALAKAVDSVGSEVKAKYLVVSGELNSEMSEVFQLIDKEMESFSVQMEALKTKFRRFYQRNDLHIRDMGEQARAAFNEILQQIQVMISNYHAFSNSFAKATSDWLLEMKAYPIAQKYSITIQELMYGLKNFREVLEAALDEVATELNKMSGISYKKYLEFSRAIDRKLQSYTRSLNELPIYRKMMEQKLRLGQIGVGNIPGWTQLYSAAYLSGQQMLQDQYHDIMMRPEFQHLHAMATEVHQQIMQWSMEQTMDAAVKRSIDLMKNLMLMELIKLRSYLVDLEKTRVIVFDPERGELQFELHLPIPLKSLTEPPEFNIEKYVNNLKKWGQINLPATNYSVWDTYYDNVPSLEPAAYYPPFEASAYLIGGQHYITFDETHFDYLSTCSHVLTRDMVNDNFSVVINYEHKSQRDGVKSLCFTFENTLNLEILSDYKLEVNGRETEMPFISDRVKIVREGDFIHVQYAGGLDVYCNPKLELYKVTLKGWYHGQVAGLLGTFDNEGVNEKVTNQIAQDFEINRRQCLSKNSALNPDPALDLDQMCSQIFDESLSKFRPCFKQVNPTPFVRMCQIYMGKMTENEAIHLVTEQYRHVCKGHGVYIGPLKEYVPCNNEMPIIVEGTDPLYQSADILFVIEDSSCNQWASTTLTYMVTEINNALTTKGYKDNRFGLQGYGGFDPHEVTVRTINGQYFGEASTFLKAAETLRLPKTENYGDLASAVRSAIDYPFRTGVAKVLIIAPCSSCEVGLFERGLAGQLSSKGFVTHILKQQRKNNEDNNNVKKFKINDADNSNVLSNSKLKGVQSVDELTYCNTLVETTNGSFFDTTRLYEKGRVQKDFIQMFARKVGWGATLPPCQNCKCSLESGQTECHLCSADMINYYLPWKGPSFYEAIGSLHDINYDMKTYFGLAK